MQLIRCTDSNEARLPTATGLVITIYRGLNTRGSFRDMIRGKAFTSKRLSEPHNISPTFLVLGMIRMASKMKRTITTR